MKRSIKFYTILFFIGFFGYGLLEITWRGFTHPTMGLAGGVSLCVLSLIESKLKELNMIYKAILGGLFITSVEFTIGLIMNIGLNAGIWDYSLMPLNLLGQISFSFSVVWCAISIPVMKLTEIIRKHLQIPLKNDQMQEIKTT